ncbi:unnamed protein product [Jaminaea pallidilutea]
MKLLSTRLASSSCLAPTLLLSSLLFTSSASTVAAAPFQTASLSTQAPLRDFDRLPESLKAAALMSSSEGGDQISQLAEQRIADAQALFGAKPSLDIFKRSWAPDAIFEDPICWAQGWRQYAAQWYAMRLFSRSTTSAWRVIKDTPEEIQYIQKQNYAIDRFNFEKTMHSTVVMKLDEQGRIKHFVDRWDHQDMPGIWSYPLRRLNALSMPMIIGHPSQHPDHGSSSGNKKEL